MLGYFHFMFTLSGQWYPDMQRDLNANEAKFKKSKDVNILLVLRVILK